ncbi:hypothetical protein E1301_Tti019666 [Triplophysa tibetana]|uniref:ribonuclease H n=1 Tax=Triplophysa tibetana TaxID=1572043 RepID=A0A5A9PJN8_9TELE|nr:hypothetical protein E1301_Tti019666 [Triplophysa tibetana]
MARSSSMWPDGSPPEGTTSRAYFVETHQLLVGGGEPRTYHFTSDVPASSQGTRRQVRTVRAIGLAECSLCMSQAQAGSSCWRQDLEGNRWENIVYRPNPAIRSKSFSASSINEVGVLEQTHSPYNTPIYPVVKADGKTWRLTQELRAVNQLIIPLATIVPDVLTVMNSEPHSHKYFTLIDLCKAFFSVPVHPDTQPLLTFTFKGQQYSWKHLAQGYADSPAVFSAAVHRTLAKMTDLPSSVCVLQFADDILLSGETEEDCEKASVIDVFQPGYPSALCASEIMDSADHTIIVEEELAEEAIKIYILQSNGADTDVGIVIEGIAVLKNLANLIRACCCLLGLTYSLGLRYRKTHRYSFEMFQKLLLELDPAKLSVKVHRLKKQLLG